MGIDFVQVPGVQRRRVGEFIITAINDGFIELPPESIIGVSAAEIDALYLKAGRRPPYRTAINCYHVHTAEGGLLVDAGCGAFMGDHLGKAAGNLSAAGILPEEINVLFLTHLHTDHVGGTLTPSGDAAYPRATISVSARELDYWSNRANVGSSPEATRDAFDVVERMTEAYDGRLRLLDGPTELLSGVCTLPLPGHTPGHTGLKLGSDGADLIICGDIFHAAELQLARPDTCMVFDVDPRQAAATRRELLDSVSASDILLAGMHVVFPGFLRVMREEDRYAGYPEPWQYELLR